MAYCSVVVVLASVGLTKERFGHYAIFIPQITKKTFSQSKIKTNHYQQSFEMDSFKDETV